MTDPVEDDKPVTLTFRSVLSRPVAEELPRPGDRLRVVRRTFTAMEDGDDYIVDLEVMREE